MYLFIFIDKVGLRRLKKDKKPNQKRDLSLSLSPSSPKSQLQQQFQLVFMSNVKWHWMENSIQDIRLWKEKYWPMATALPLTHNIILIRKHLCNILRNSSLISKVESNYIMSTQLWQKYHCKNIPTRELYLSFVVKTIEPKILIC